MRSINGTPKNRLSVFTVAAPCFPNFSFFLRGWPVFYAVDVPWCLLQAGLIMQAGSRSFEKGNAMSVAGQLRHFGGCPVF